MEPNQPDSSLSTELCEKWYNFFSKIVKLIKIKPKANPENQFPPS